MHSTRRRVRNGRGSAARLEPPAVGRGADFGSGKGRVLGMANSLLSYDHPPQLLHTEVSVAPTLEWSRLEGYQSQVGLSFGSQGHYFQVIRRGLLMTESALSRPASAFSGQMSSSAVPPSSDLS